MKSISTEITEIERGEAHAEDNVLKNAPHTDFEVVSDVWSHGYGREKAAFPLDYIRENKFWPSVARIDDAYGDRNRITSYNVCYTKLLRAPHRRHERLHCKNGASINREGSCNPRKSKSIKRKG